MKMLLGKKKKLMLSCFLAGVFLAWMISVAFALTPGSSEDPLVTSSWVEKYLDAQFEPLEEQVSDMQTELVDFSDHITLYLGVSKAWIGGRAQVMDVPPQIVGGYTMLPLRLIGEALDISVSWDNANKTVTCKSSSKTVILPVGGKTASIDGKSYAMPCAPIQKDGRVLAPTRFIAEAFGCQVTWDGNQKKIDIDS